MARPPQVVGRFVAPEESRNAPVLFDGVQATPPTRQHLVGIALVPDIPHHLVVGNRERLVEGHGQFDDA